MKVKAAEFIRSCVHRDQYPRESLPELAFVGRSNVGKSSLINSLLNRKALAKISTTPGKTRTVNFFRVTPSDPSLQDFYLVDLPGYGYAKVSKKERGAWQKLIEDYLKHAPNLCGVVIIVDLRRGPEDEEYALCEFLAHYKRPFVVVATKCDKLKRSQRERQRKILGERLDGYPPLLFSAQDGIGTDAVWNTIESFAAQD